MYDQGKLKQVREPMQLKTGKQFCGIVTCAFVNSLQSGRNQVT